MKLLKPPPLYFTLTLTGCLLLSMTPAAQGFIALVHDRGQQPDAIDAMIDKVHEPHWDITYRYGDDCPPEERNNGAALTAAVTEALQMWLQPLRDYTQRPIVNDFRYRLNVGRKDADFTIVFFCKIAGSLAWVGGGSPRIDLREGTEITPDFMSILVHEMGHIFGLADTYLRNNPELSKGGSDSTKGTQPDSAMSVLTTFHKGGGLLGRDDKIGIVWLYKVAYEGLGLRDCFFPDYELEVGPTRLSSQVSAHLCSQVQSRGASYRRPTRRPRSRCQCARRGRHDRAAPCGAQQLHAGGHSTGAAS